MPLQKMKKHPVRTRCHERKKRGDVVENNGGRELFFRQALVETLHKGVTFQVPKLRAQHRCQP